MNHMLEDSPDAPWNEAPCWVEEEEETEQPIKDKYYENE